jgi:hypothetical protein
LIDTIDINNSKHKLKGNLNMWCADNVQDNPADKELTRCAKDIAHKECSPVDDSNVNRSSSNGVCKCTHNVLDNPDASKLVKHAHWDRHESYNAHNIPNIFSNTNSDADEEQERQERLRVSQ